MKKLLLVSVITIICFTVNAQDDAPSEIYGVKAGFNSLNVRASVEGISASANAAGFYIGLFGEFGVSEKFDIQPEIQFVGVVQDGENSNLLLIPILVKFKPSQIISLLAGPQFDYLLDKESDGVKKFGFGLATGLVFDITDKFILDTRYVFGLSNRLENSDEFEGSDIKVNMNYIQVGLGYRF